MSLKKVVECVKKHNNFLITTHINSEGDALGSELAFYRLVKSLGKRAVIINDDILPSGYDFLPGLDKIQRFKNNLKDTKFDCFAILDCSDLKRCGQVSALALDNKIILNIDHHISNARFGDINWIEADSSSCAEMVYKLYKAMRIPVHKDTATLLYTGIVTDTGSFHYSNTNALTHRIAADLVRYNLDIPGIYRNVYENIPFADAELLFKILPTIKTMAAGKIAWFKVERRMLKSFGVSFDLTEQILSFARSIKDVEVVALFKENLKSPNEIRVNFRSRGKTDVNRIAGFFGGGGHRTASGCTIKGRLDRVSRMVLKKLAEHLK